MVAQVEGLVNTVMEGSSAVATMEVSIEAAVEVIVAGVGSIPGQVEGGGKVGLERCRSAV